MQLASWGLDGVRCSRVTAAGGAARRGFGAFSGAAARAPAAVVAAMAAAVAATTIFTCMFRSLRVGGCASKDAGGPRSFHSVARLTERGRAPSVAPILGHSAARLASRPGRDDDNPVVDARGGMRLRARGASPLAAGLRRRGGLAV